MSGGIATVAALGESGLEVLLDAVIARNLVQAAQPMTRSCTLLDLALELRPCPLASGCSVGDQGGRHQVPAATYPGASLDRQVPMAAYQKIPRRPRRPELADSRRTLLPEPHCQPSFEFSGILG